MSNLYRHSARTACVAVALLAVGPRSHGIEVGREKPIEAKGQWRIVVRDERGGEVLRREFGNTLSAAGSDALLSLLTRAESIAGWRVVLAPTGSAPCALANGMGAPCLLTDNPTLGDPKMQTVLSLHVTIGPGAGASGRGVRMTGALRAARSGVIDAVTIAMGVCPGSAAPAAPCANPAVRTFSSASAEGKTFAPFSVQDRHRIEVDVVISFS